MFTSISRQNHDMGTEENLLDIQVRVCYNQKQKIAKRDRLTPRSSIV